MWDEFVQRKVYLEKEFICRLPNKNGTIEIQNYSLLNDLWFYFVPNYNNNNKNIKISDLFDIFCILQKVYDDFDNKTELESIIIFNYLMCILHIYIQRFWIYWIINFSFNY